MTAMQLLSVTQKFTRPSVCLSQKASLLGFKNHAAFILDMRMAKDPAAVTKFLSDLKDKLQPLKTEEMDLFLQYKKEEVRCSHDTLTVTFGRDIVLFSCKLCKVCNGFIYI